MKNKRKKPAAKQEFLGSKEHHLPGTAVLDPRLAAAVARGKVLTKKMAAMEGGAVSSAETARLLGISETDVMKKWRDHRLVGWKEGKAVHFPVWQFKDGELQPGIEQILQTFRSDDQWRVMGYFLGKRLSLHGQRPLDLLRSGETARVIEHAKAYAIENTW